MVSCWNRGEATFQIMPGNRIAQMVVVPICKPKFEWVDAFTSTERGGGGLWFYWYLKRFYYARNDSEY